MFGRRYVVTCSDCDTEYVFKSGKRTKLFYEENETLCPTCGEPLSLWLPLSRLRLTPPPELKRYEAKITVVRME